MKYLDKNGVLILKNPFLSMKQLQIVFQTQNNVPRLNGILGSSSCKLRETIIVQGFCIQ